MPSGKRFKLHHEFTYLWRYNGRPIKITVPAGFETDFASIPRILRLIIPKLGRHNKAAVIHDYIYQFHRVYIEPYVLLGFDRLMADQCFRDGMRDRGVSRWERELMFLAVRSFGWLAWVKRK